METVERSVVQLQDGAVPQLERPLLVFYICSNDFDGEIELPEAVFGLTLRNLVPVAQ
jgi:hypothetical protein